MPTLDDVINRFRADAVDEADWLYVAGDIEELGLQTPADLGCPGFDEVKDEEVDPPGFEELGLSSTIDAQTVRDSIKWADELSGSRDNAAAAKIIRYYIRFDAWPESLDAPDPPPAEQIALKLQREFADSLGPERSEVSCRADDCDRGAVPLSVYCRRHHFENIQRTPYPFDD